jgi:hypothetical protein
MADNTDIDATALVEEVQNRLHDITKEENWLDEGYWHDFVVRSRFVLPSSATPILQCWTVLTNVSS